MGHLIADFQNSISIVTSIAALLDISLRAFLQKEIRRHLISCHLNSNDQNCHA